MTIEYASSREAPGPQPAASWRRWLATAIDAGAWILIAVVEGRYLDRISRGPLFAANPLLEALWFALLSILMPAYLFVEVLTGASVGKQLTGLRVGSFGGAKSSLRRLVLRWALKSSPWLFNAAVHNFVYSPPQWAPSSLLLAVFDFTYSLDWILESIEARVPAVLQYAVYLLNVGWYLMIPVAFSQLAIFGRFQASFIDRLTKTRVFARCPQTHLS